MTDEACVILYVHGDYSGQMTYPFSVQEVQAWEEVCFLDHGPDTNFEWSVYVGVKSGTEDAVIQRLKAIRRDVQASVTSRYQRPYKQTMMRG